MNADGSGTPNAGNVDGSPLPIRSAATKSRNTKMMLEIGQSAMHNWGRPRQAKPEHVHHTTNDREIGGSVKIVFTAEQDEKDRYNFE
jgi:hypothetical protein